MCVLTQQQLKALNGNSQWLAKTEQRWWPTKKAKKKKLAKEKLNTLRHISKLECNLSSVSAVTFPFTQ